MSGPVSTQVERTTQLVHPSLPDLDAALAWVVQTVEREGFDAPHVEIRPRTWWDADSPERKTTDYEVTVKQMAVLAGSDTEDREGQQP